MDTNGVGWRDWRGRIRNSPPASSSRSHLKLIARRLHVAWGVRTSALETGPKPASRRSRYRRHQRVATVPPRGLQGGPWPGSASPVRVAWGENGVGIEELRQISAAYASSPEPLSL